MTGGLRVAVLGASGSWHSRGLIAALTARGHEVLHLVRPHERQPHRPYDEAETRNGRLYLCGELVA